MALALTVAGAIDTFILANLGTVTSLAIIIPAYRGAKEYLDKGKLIDLIPESDKPSRELVTRTGLGDLTALDGTLVGTSTAGMILLFKPVPGARVAGAALLLASYLAGKERSNAKFIALTSSAAAAILANPFKAAQVAIQLGGVAANTTINGVASAMQLSATAIGLLVTISGAVVGYVLLKKD